MVEGKICQEPWGPISKPSQSPEPLLQRLWRLGEDWPSTVSLLENLLPHTDYAAWPAGQEALLLRTKRLHWFGLGFRGLGV